MRKNLLPMVLGVSLLCGCATSSTQRWHLKLAHDREGQVLAGNIAELATAIRSGCRIRIAWGARRRNNPEQTIEHVADALWVSLRNGNVVEAQVEGFLSNLAVLGESSAEHSRYERFGGTENVILWRAELTTDGTFDAIWYGAVDGKLKFRAPQRHPMRWFADCESRAAAPLYPPDV